MAPSTPPDRQLPAHLFRTGALVSLGAASTLIGLYALYTVRAILIRILIALFIAVSLDPAVRLLARRGLRRGVAVTLIFLLAFALAAGFLISVIPPLVDQFRNLVDDLPGYLARLQLRSGVVRLFPVERRPRARQVVDLVVDKVGGYMIGNIIISIIAGVASLIAFSLLGVPFPVPLAFVVALCDLIPMIGATLGAVIGVTVALFSTGLWPTTVLVAAFFVAYQQLENYLIAPRVLKTTVELGAAAVLIAGLLGATVLGLVGAIMAIPVAAAFNVLLNERLVAQETASGASPIPGAAAAVTRPSPDQAPAPPAAVRDTGGGAGPPSPAEVRGSEPRDPG